MKKVAEKSFNVVPKEADQKPLYLGHRQRLKQKFAEHPTAVSDYELLELLLFNVFTRKDTKPIAKVLLKKFSGIKNVICSPETELAEISDLGDATINFFKLLKETFRRMSLQQVSENPIISSNLHVLEYYDRLLSFERKEQFRAMFINNKNRLIAEEAMQYGTIDQTAVYPRELIQKALNYGASAIIIVHNHPSGDSSPSVDDIELTKKINGIAKQIGIKLLDHVIIGKNGTFSFAEKHLL